MWNEGTSSKHKLRNNRISKRKGDTIMKVRVLQLFTLVLTVTLVLTLSVSAIGKNHWAVDYVDFTYNTGILSDTRSGVGTSETITTNCNSNLRNN